MNTDRTDMNIVIVGHVDHGKSTIIGRMLADTHSLPEGKLEQVKETCRRNSKPFEYAFLLDALKDEQAQGITIDAARCFFKTAKRNYIIIDAPGHVEFLKNMVTGAARAEAALLVIDAKEGVQENSTRHGYLLSMLGIKQVSVLVNKMDLVDYDKEVYDRIVAEYSAFLKEIDVTPRSFIPVSGFEGDNVAFAGTENMPWYTGHTVLQQLDDFENEAPPEDKPFRMPVQGVYKFTKDGDDRRIVAGTVDTGQVRVGDDVVFYPSGKRSRVRSIEVFNAPNRDSAGAGCATGFTLDHQIYIKRGELCARADQQRPKASTLLKANLFWLGRNPLTADKQYFIKLGTAKVPMRLEKVLRVLDASRLTGSEKQQVERHEVAECVLKTDRAIAFDLGCDIAPTSRFVIVDEYEISGGGIIQEELADAQDWMRRSVAIRNLKWEQSEITLEQRTERNSHKALMVLISGNEDAGKKPIAKALEKILFNEGKQVYFMGIGNLLYGMDADIRLAEGGNHKEEHFRRLAEAAYLLLDTGMIFIVTATNVRKSDLDIITTSIDAEQMLTVWIGDETGCDMDCDAYIGDNENVEQAAQDIKELLQNKGAIYRPW